ncbi:MAG: hypothetical protein HY231_16680 [Acidobacteria bacterium]|nr:hypothetical protein [Acidobacteriota bacterium]
MRINKIVLIGLLFVLSTGATAQDKEKQIRKSELIKSPMVTGPFRIIITKLRTAQLSLMRGDLYVEVQNTSHQFANFSPQKLTLVASDNLQLRVLTVTSKKGEEVCAADTKIVPGASLEEVYNLSDVVRLPVRLYYDEQLLAVITD